MRGNTFGEVFTVTTAGESHGPEITTIIDGVPSGLTITPEIIQADLDRRRPGQNEYTTPRDEKDQLRITSGVYQNTSTGAPITLSIPNTNTRSEDYAATNHLYRPGHADITYDLKYGLRDPNGGGRSSYRVMVGLVAAGAIAKQFIHPVAITAFVDQIGNIRADVDGTPTTNKIEQSPIRCPDPVASAQMQELILEATEAGDSIGGSIAFVVDGVEAGLGEPIFGKVNSRLGAAMLAINATTGVEFGWGFEAARLKGSEYNDPILEKQPNKVVTATNNSGGTQGGITNGMPITGRVAFHPTASISANQDTVDTCGEPATISIEGRHDPCVLPRAVPAVEAMAALVIADLTMLRRLDKATK